MRLYSLFSTVTGEGIGQGGVAHMSYDSLAGPDEIIFEGSLVRTHWYDTESGELVDKTDMGASIDTTTTLPGGTATVSGIPAGVKAEVGDSAVQIDDGTLTLTTVDPGNYAIYLTHKKNFPVNFEVVCDD